MNTLPTAQLMSNAHNPAMHTASRRPELRVTTDSSLVFVPPSPPSPTNTPSDTTDTMSPTDTVTDEVPPNSTGSPYAPSVVAHFTVPLTRAAYVSPGSMHAPYPHTHLLPDPIYRFGSAPQQPAAGPSSAPSSAVAGAHAPRRLTHSSSLDSSWSSASSSRAPLAHPYARIYAKKAEAPSVKRRKMWNHALEKSVFTPEEIATLGAPNRRAIYTASLEHHIDQLHNQLLSLGLYPVPMESLDPYRGLNSKTAKSMVAGLHKDACDMKTKLMELERATQALYRDGLLKDQVAEGEGTDGAAMQARRHSLATASYVYPNLFATDSSSVVS